MRLLVVLTSLAFAGQISKYLQRVSVWPARTETEIFSHASMDPQNLHTKMLCQWRSFWCLNFQIYISTSMAPNCRNIFFADLRFCKLPRKPHVTDHLVIFRPWELSKRPRKYLFSWLFYATYRTNLLQIYHKRSYIRLAFRAQQY